MPTEIVSSPHARSYDAHDPTLADALARPQTIFFAGREIAFRPLNFNDLADLEERFGDLENIETDKIKDQRFMIWFILSRAEPTLTEEEVGAGLTLDKSRDVSSFIRHVFVLSGFRQEAAQGETPNPNAPELAESQPADSGTGSSTSSPSLPSAAGTRRKSPAK